MAQQISPNPEPFKRQFNRLLSEMNQIENDWNTGKNKDWAKVEGPYNRILNEIDHVYRKLSQLITVTAKEATCGFALPNNKHLAVFG